MPFAAGTGSSDAGLAVESAPSACGGVHLLRSLPSGSRGSTDGDMAGIGVGIGGEDVGEVVGDDERNARLVDEGGRLDLAGDEQRQDAPRAGVVGVVGAVAVGGAGVDGGRGRVA